MKTVSWADDNLWSYLNTSQDKWEHVRDAYLDQIHALDNLHIQIQRSINLLHAHSERLLRADDTIRSQKNLLTSTFDTLEHKQRQFKSRVQEALTDAKR